MSTGDRIWNPDQQEDISYLKEMLTSQTSFTGLLFTLLIAALLSIPLGLGMAAIPILSFVAIEAIAALFIPSSPVFQARIQKRKRSERREKLRTHLTNEIERRQPQSHNHWKAYHRMRDRIASLHEVASRRQNALSDRDVERLDDATVNFLSMWLAWLVMEERWKTTNESDLEKRIRSIDKRLEKIEKPVERRRLEKARSELQVILQRRQSLWDRATAVEAAMLSMTDTLEEVYQRMMTNPNAGDVREELQAAVARMQVEEELDLAVDSELDDILSDTISPAQRAAAARITQ